MTGTKRLRIAILTRNFGKSFGGAEHYSVAVAEHLSQLHEIHIFAQKIDHQHQNLLYHLIWNPLPKPRWLNQLWYAAASWWLTRTGFDLVHSHENTWHGNIQTIHVRPFRIGLFQQRKGLRLALRWLSLITSPRLLTYWFLERARMQPRANRRIVATSEAVLTEIRQAYPDVANHLITIPPGVTIPNSSADVNNIRLNLGLPTSKPLALFVAHNYEKKGLSTLLQAMTSFPMLHLAVVGDTKQQPTFQQQALSLGIDQRVHFLGRLTNVTPAYDAADFLIHPTTEDTYGMVVLEAMAHTMPVVVSGPSHCGISATLVHGREVLILDDPYDTKQLELYIQILLNQPQRCESLAQAGHRFAQNKSWQALATQYDEIITNLSKSRLENLSN